MESSGTCRLHLPLKNAGEDAGDATADRYITPNVVLKARLAGTLTLSAKGVALVAAATENIIDTILLTALVPEVVGACLVLFLTRAVLLHAQIPSNKHVNAS